MDAVEVYVRAVTRMFDLQLIKEYLTSSCLFVTFDCMHGVASRYLDPVLHALGVDLRSCYLNQVARPDFNGCTPSAMNEHCSTSNDLFNVKLVHADDAALDAVVTLEDTARLSTDCPDLGFVVDADVNRCLVC